MPYWGIFIITKPKNMTFYKLILILLFSSLCSSNSFSQDSESTQDYAEIIFVPWTGKTYRENYARVYLNRKLITSMKMNEIVKYKIHSRGRIIFNVYYSETEYYEATIEVNENKTYHFVLGAPYKKQKNKLISENLAKEMMGEYTYNNTIELEEDITKPIGKLPKNITKKGGGSGTGFLLSDKGYIVTNFHVIDGAETITVRGINGEYGSSFEASVISSDHANDLAILKVNSTLINFPSPPYSIQNSKAVKKGEKVFALGYPRKDLMGNELKVTNGIINAESGYKGSISQFQFSAAVQFGNSGGPLINSEGNIIGVVNSKLNPQLAEAAGYAIKSDYLSFFIDQSEKVEYVPTKNTMAGEELPEQLEKISKFIYIIETK
jgi:S1-C subfamily serine protease